MKKTLLLFLAFLFLIPVKSNAQTQRTNLPTFYINTNNGATIQSKVNYVRATITVVSSESTEAITKDSIGIRRRGNSTSEMPKKPYRIKFDEKTNLLNLPAKEKSWVLLANYADKTLMRNAVAFKISQLVGMEFSPSARFVDLVLNGAFLGNYMISDQIQVGKNRVNIDELKNADINEQTISGGYLLEIDGFASSEPVWFTTPKGLKITVKSPDEEEINATQKNYIINYINNFENKLFSSDFKDPDNGYRALVDTTSLINWYIACELTGNSDSFWSTYIYKKRGVDKLFFGPMWDYDIAFNNDSRLGDATRKLMRENAHNPKAWVQRFYTDEWFQRAVRDRWNQLLANNIENTLVNYITETQTLLQSSQQANFERWNILSTKVYNETFLFNTYDEGVNYLKKYIHDRIAFLTESFVYNEPPKPSEPFVVDRNYYYMIINQRSNNVIDCSLTDNSILQLWEPKAEDNDDQLWSIVPLGGDYYRFVNVLSGLAMTGNGKGNNLKQIPVDENNDAQKWQIVPVLTGNMYGLLNKASNLSVNNSGGGLANGTAVIEYDNNMFLEDKVNQHWYIQKMTAVPGWQPDEPKKIYVNEISGNDKWLEIYNDENEPVLLSGYKIRKIDEKGAAEDWNIPAGTTIAAKGYLTWTQDKNNADGSTFKWGISPSKDVGFKLFDEEDVLLDFFDVKVSTLNSEGLNRTVGRQTDASPTLILFANGGTKGTSNNTGIAYVPEPDRPQLTNLPTLYIDTENQAPVVDQDNYVIGTLSVVSSITEEVLSNVALEIKGRGNSTWELDKKPYRLKLGSKTNLLNLPAKAKDWVLLANHSDQTLLRNAAALGFSQIAGFEFTPSVRFADVVLNDVYVGTYLLTDQVEVAENRVGIEEQLAEDIAEPNITGGYLLEIDESADSEPKWFETDKDVKITIKYPKDDKINSAQENYIKNHINLFESRLFAANYNDPETGYRSLIDSVSLVNWYIASELTGNPDAFKSTYLYKKRSNDKIFFGPLWDFDLAFNNDVRLGDMSEKLMREDGRSARTWITQIWKDEWFQEAVERRWNELVDDNLESTLVDYVSATSGTIQQSALKNFGIWSAIPAQQNPEQYLLNIYTENVDNLKTYIGDRIAFLTEKFKYIPTSICKYNVAENTPVYEVRNGVLYISAIPEKSDVSIFDMKGQMVYLKKSVNKGELSVAITQPGVYVLKVYSNDYIYTTKIVR